MMPVPSPAAVSPVSVRSRRARRSTWIRRTLAATAATAALAGAALVVHADDSGGSAYRSVVAATGDVDHEYTGVATVEPQRQATVGFPTAGTVATVEVIVGDVVSIGQQIATLDTVELERQLREKQAALAEAQLVLSVALDGDDPSSVVQSSGASGQGPMSFASVAATGAAATSSVGRASDRPEVSTAQQAVLAAQQDVDAAVADAQAAMISAMSICTAVAAAAEPAAAITACQAALDGVIAAQRLVSEAQATVSSASADLDAVLVAWAAELEATAPATTTPAATAPATTTPAAAESTTSEPTTIPTDGESTTPGGSTRASGSAPSAGGGSGAATDTPTAEDLVAYQYAVDAAQYEVQAAEQAIAQARIVSPIDGTVTDVGLAVGDRVEATSATQAVVIEGAGGYEATTTVSINDVADFEVGQAASIVPDGAEVTLTGEVVAISPTPEDSSTSYRVTVGLDDPTSDSAGLHNGNIGTLAIVTAAATGAVTVPTSAVRLVGTQHVVSVIEPDGTVAVTPVTIGAVGAERTEVTSGVELGDRVVLADLSV